jgi:hypothetical protein
MRVSSARMAVKRRTTVAQRTNAGDADDANLRARASPAPFGRLAAARAVHKGRFWSL